MVLTHTLLVALALTSANPSAGAIAGLTFHRVPGGGYGHSVLEAGDGTSFHSSYVSGPTVVYDGQLYRMWFAAGRPTKSQDGSVPYGIDECIGLAISEDGIHWELANDGQSVLDAGPAGSADAKGLAHPFVLRIGKQFWMWYSAIDGLRGQDINQGPAHVRIERICLATSDDGIHWQRENEGRPVLDIGPAGSTDSVQVAGMHVLRSEGKFVMWYGAYNGKHTLMMATSPDGVHWTKANDGQPVTGLDGSQQLGPSAYFDGRRYLMLYNKDLNGSWATFSATSDDGINWKPANDSQPLLGPPPTGNFDTAGKGRNHSVHPSQILLIGNKVRVWYGGEDGSPPHKAHIGLMEATLP